MQAFPGHTSVHESRGTRYGHDTVGIPGNRKFKAASDAIEAAGNGRNET